MRRLIFGQALVLTALIGGLIATHPACNHQLTAQEAASQVDVACVLLARALAQGDAEKVERLVAQACTSDHVRAVMEKALVKIESERARAEENFTLEPYPATSPTDGGLE